MPTTPEEDLAQLEKDIRTLKIEYEQFFGGGRQRPPADTQWRVESLIRRYSDRSAQMSYSQRFRYTNIAQTFAKYCAKKSRNGKKAPLIAISDPRPRRSKPSVPQPNASRSDSVRPKANAPPHSRCL